MTETQYFLGDALGSVRQLTDDAGDMTLMRRYEPYGDVLESVGTGTTSYGFTGELFDSTGLIYLRARYLATSTGTFASSDPSRLERNRFQYAGSNPVMNSDPSGLLFWRWRGPRANLMTRPSTYVRSNAPAHPWIEYWIEQQHGFWNTHLEFPGGNTLNIDAVVLHTANQLQPPLSPGNVAGSVFEIEPAEPLAIIRGWAEIQGKAFAMQVGLPPFVHQGNLPISDHWFQPRPIGPYAGAAYDWSGVRWQLGAYLSVSQPIGPVRVAPSNYPGLSNAPNAYWIMLITDGLIIYVDELTLRQVGVATSAVAVGEYLRQMY